MTDTPKKIVTISKSDLAVLPAETYDGDIVVVDSLDKVASAIEVLRASDIIGFDTETRPSFKKGQSHVVALMQLSTRSVCFLFRLNLIGIPDSLRELLEDPDKLKIGLSLHDDFHNLDKICKINPQGFIDLQPFVKDYMIADNSLTRIYAILFSRRISKGQRLTNWEAKELTQCQQTYAALDAMACINIYDTLTAGEFDPVSSPYLSEEITDEHQHEARS